MRAEQSISAAAGSAGRYVLLLFVIAAAVRVGWVIVRSGGENIARLQCPDEDAYLGLARSLASGHGLVDEFGFRATYMPAYPAFLALFEPLPGALLWSRLAQALLAAWVAPATFLLTREWCRLTQTSADSGRIALVAGLLAAFDPFLIFFSHLLLTESIFTAVLVSAWVFVVTMARPNVLIRRWHVAGAGALLWLCVMLRPSAMVPVLAAPPAIVLCRRFDRSSIAGGITILAIVLAGMLPWAIRNRATIGEWRWLTTRGGISLYDGLREGATGGSDLAHTKTMSEVTGLSETQWDRYFRARALADARRDPPRALRLSGQKLLRTWSVLPNVELYRRGAAALVSGLWMLLILISGAAGAWISRRNLRALFLLLLPVILVTLMHMVFVGSVRYRLPLMPMVMVLSATGLVHLVWHRRLGGACTGGTPVPQKLELP